MLDNNHLKVRDLAVLTGKLVATDPGNKWAKIKSKTIVRALNWNLRNCKNNYSTPCTITRWVRESLQFWLLNLEGACRDYEIMSRDR